MPLRGGATDMRGRGATEGGATDMRGRGATEGGVPLRGVPLSHPVDPGNSV